MSADDGFRKEDMKYSSNRAHTYLGDPKWSYCSKEKDEEKIFPNYPGICKAFGVQCERVLHKKDLDAATLRQVIDDLID